MNKTASDNLVPRRLSIPKIPDGETTSNRRWTISQVPAPHQVLLLLDQLGICGDHGFVQLSYRPDYDTIAFHWQYLRTRLSAQRTRPGLHAIRSAGVTEREASKADDMFIINPVYSVGLLRHSGETGLCRVAREMLAASAAAIDISTPQDRVHVVLPMPQRASQCQTCVNYRRRFVAAQTSY